ncbi:MAG: DUF4384 domain-containing protein [Elusimicrobiota bacterium]
MLKNILAGALLTAVALPVQAKTVERAAAQIVKNILDQGLLKEQKVAVGSLKDPQGRLTALSTLLAQELESSLAGQAKAYKFQLLDRSNTQTLVDEWKLGMQGLVDEETAAQAGKLVGMDVLFVGKYVVRDDEISWQVSLIDTETGEIKGVASAAIKTQDDLKALHEKAVGMKAEAEGQGGLIRLMLWSAKNEYKIGESMQFHVSADQDCYLTLIDVGTSGSATIIFPNNYSPSNWVKKGVTYTIPDRDAGFEFEVGGPQGVELVRAIASRHPSVDLKDAMKSFSEDAPFAGVDDPGILTRDISVKKKKAKPGEWTEAVLKIRIR